MLGQRLLLAPTAVLVPGSVGHLNQQRLQNITVTDAARAADFISCSLVDTLGTLVYCTSSRRQQHYIGNLQVVAAAPTAVEPYLRRTAGGATPVAAG